MRFPTQLRVLLASIFASARPTNSIYAMGNAVALPPFIRSRIAWPSGKEEPGVCAEDNNAFAFKWSKDFEDLGHSPELEALVHATTAQVAGLFAVCLKHRNEGTRFGPWVEDADQIFARAQNVVYEVLKGIEEEEELPSMEELGKMVRDAYISPMQAEYCGPPVQIAVDSDSSQYSTAHLGYGWSGSDNCKDGGSAEHSVQSTGDTTVEYPLPDGYVPRCSEEDSHSLSSSCNVKGCSRCERK